MGHQSTQGLCVVYLASRDTDTQLEVNVLGSDSLDTAVRAARAKVENMAFAGVRRDNSTGRFVIENCEGDELYRWYRAG